MDVSALRRESDSWLGVAIGGCIVSLWFVSLAATLAVDVAQLPAWSIAVAVLGRTFLHTGLFITAHDAMDSSLLPQHPRINRAIGQMAVWLYAWLPYERCRTNHLDHHRHPNQPDDPDFHRGNSHPIHWYLQFIREYFSARQLVLFAIGNGGLFAVLSGLLGTSPLNILLFWCCPLVLSSMQLFFFGTYLPHREPAWNSPSAPIIRSLPFPVWRSFLTCYHLGYHWEHHTFPNIPWYRLTEVHHRCQKASDFDMP